MTTCSPFSKFGAQLAQEKVERIAADSALSARIDDQEQVLTGVVALRRPDMDTVFFTPSGGSGSSQMEALQEALEAAEQTPGIPAAVELLSGTFLIAAGLPMITYAPTAKVTVTCSGGAAHVYEDPEDAGEDWMFFEGDRLAVNFGVVPDVLTLSYVDYAPNIQAAANALLHQNPYNTASGRKLRTGRLILPAGTIHLGSTVFISPSAHLIGEGSAATLLRMLSGWASTPDPDAVDGERFAIHFEDAQAGVDTNNLFATQVQGVTLTDPDPMSSPYGSGLRVVGGQGTIVKDSQVHLYYLRGIFAQGCSFQMLWVSDIVRGPGLDWYGGGTADNLSVEHINPGSVNDLLTGEPYPQMQLSAGTYFIGSAEGEEGSANPHIFCRIHNVVNCVIGSSIMGILPLPRTHTLYRITGTSQNVRLLQMTGSFNGYFPIDIGTLVRDTSTNSPAGSGVEYLMTETAGSYSQADGGYLPGLAKANTWTGANTFTGDTVIGAPGTVKSLTVLSSLGTVYIAGGAYENLRTTSYFNFTNPRPHDWNNGKMTLTTTGTLNLTLAYQVAGVQVVGAQGAAVANGVAAVSAPTQTEFNNLVTQFNLLLSRMRAHGLIAP